MIKNNPISVYPAYPLEKLDYIENILFFDIETTGFSKEHCSIYLIGCCYYNGQWNYIQWFNENGEKESEILQYFLSFSQKYKTLIHYNGLSFDLSFIDARCQKYKIKNSLTSLQQIDLYLILKPYKNFLGLSSLKQKDVEEFCSVNRTDPYDGGQLIKIYENYLLNPSLETEEKLLLHNKEDILGLMEITQMLSYISIFKQDFTIESLQKTESTLTFYITLPSPVPRRIITKSNNIFCSINEQQMEIRVPLISDTLKFFYPNYKEYYFLPLENMAIHKSVASYVDKKYREPAKASNCYITKKGEFLPEFEPIVAPVFFTDYKSTPMFFEFNKSFENNPKLQTDYLLHLLKSLLK